MGQEYADRSNNFRLFIEDPVDIRRDKEGINKLRARYGPNGSEQDIQFQRAAPTSPAFKKWFGDSKLTDESGQPLIMYRGRKVNPNEITTPIWVTPSAPMANFYAGNEAGAINSESLKNTVVQNISESGLQKLNADYTETYEAVMRLDEKLGAMAGSLDENFFTQLDGFGRPINSIARALMDGRVGKANDVESTIDALESYKSPDDAPSEHRYFIDYQKAAQWLRDNAKELSKTMLPYLRALTRKEQLVDKIYELHHQILNVTVQGGYVEPLYVRLTNPYYTGNEMEIFNLDDEKAARLKAQGYDGMVWDAQAEGGGYSLNETLKDIRKGRHHLGLEIAVFDANQIKSATGNRGTYSLESDDIREQRAAPLQSSAAQIFWNRELDRVGIEDSTIRRVMSTMPPRKLPDQGSAGTCRRAGTGEEAVRRR
jgi:hypothetical protein